MNNKDILGVVLKQTCSLALWLTCLFATNLHAVTVNFDTTDIGVTKKSTLWTVGTSYVNESNMYIGSEIDAMRFGAVQEYPLEPDGSLGAAAKAEIDGYVTKLNLVPGLNSVTLMASSAIDKVDLYYVAANGVDIIPERWRDMFKAYIDYVENTHGLTVVLIEPGNETDYGNKYKNKDNWADIHAAFMADPVLSQYPIVGPSTLSAGAAANWWSYVKDNTDWGATHTINGTMNQYINYLLQVKGEGKPYFASENHSLAEMIICANYDCLGGLWWRVSQDKGDWTRVNQISRQIAYVEDRPNWTVATVYKEPNKIWLFASGGTRATSNSATPTTYTFTATDRDVYFDGVGPQRTYEVVVDKSTTVAVEVTWDGGDTIAPTAPTGLVATSGLQSVSLNWADNVEGDLAGYAVYRSTTQGGPYDEIATVESLSEYDDTGLTANQTYYYVVAAVDNSGNESVVSAEVSETAGSSGGGGAIDFNPTDDTYANQKDPSLTHGTEASLKFKSAGSKARQPFLKFDVTGVVPPVTSAKLILHNQLSAADATLHTVANNSWSEASLTWNNKPTIGAALGTITSPAANTWVEFDITGHVTADGTYSFAVLTSDTSSNARAFDSKESGFIPILQVTDSANVSPPAAPTGLAATADADGSITLDWNNNTEPDLQSYSVYRSTTPGGPYSSLATGVTSSTFNDNAAVLGTTYYYVVTAVDIDAEESSQSAEVFATAADTLPPEAPINLSATAGDAVVDLNWGDSFEPDFAGYRVYRSTTSGSGYSLVANGLTSSDYSDTSVVNGTTYYYVVTAADASGNESADSSEVSAAPTGPIVLSFNPVADSYNKQNKANSNFGSDTELHAKVVNGQSKDQNSYIKFTVTGVTGPVTSAKLRLFTRNTMDDVTVHSVGSSSWDEATLTWNNQPALGSALDTLTVISSGQWIELDVSTYITGDGTYTLGLSTTHSNNTARIFDSREGTNVPVLDVSF